MAIYIAPAKELPMQLVSRVRAVPGRGLEGDRYFQKQWTFSKKERPDREVTLIAIWSIHALKHDYDIELDPAQSRRNTVISGVPLNDIVGHEFRVGKATLLGLKLCKPRSHLEKLSKDGLKQGLIHRGGLRAQIITEGIISTGDEIEEVG